MSLTPQQIQLIQSSFEKVVPITEKAAELFYGRLFETAPHVKPLFAQSNMKDQGKKLMDMLTVVVRGLNRLDQLVPAVQQLGQRHARYGVKDEHYAPVGAALLWTLEQGLGPAFTSETREAWGTAYGVLATTMKDAARNPATSA